MSTARFAFRHCAAAILGALAVVLASPLGAAEPAQQRFSSPDAASAALFAVATSGDAEGIAAIFGPQGAELGSGDPALTSYEREAFVRAYAEKHALQHHGDDHVTLLLGGDDWPFPVPLVKAGDGSWHFDTEAGREEIANRRIGRNEHHTEQALLALVDAQREYATEDRDGDGVREYARKFISSKGRFDGLYWPAEAGKESPLGPLPGQAVRDLPGPHRGKPTPFWGYYYRMLYAQGPAAKGGAYDYLVRGKMLGGFAAIAWPAEYGASGVKTFIVNHDGVVYEKDLGPDTARIAKGIQRFDPGEGWQEPPKPVATR